MGGLASAPNAAGVSDCETSRMGTRMSRREPSKYTLRERGNGCTAASSTWAVVAMNLGWAFMAAPSGTEGEGRCAHAPYAGMTRIRFQGTLSPALDAGPLRLNGQYSNPRGPRGPRFQRPA